MKTLLGLLEGGGMGYEDIQPWAFWGFMSGAFLFLFLIDLMLGRSDALIWKPFELLGRYWWKLILEDCEMQYSRDVIDETRRKS